MFAPCKNSGVFERVIVYCYAKVIAQSSKILAGLAKS